MGAGLRATYPYLWFKYACVCSWLILTICFVMMITAAAAVSHLSDIASNVCAEPEIKMGIAAAESLRGKSCKEALECFASCVDDTPLVTSNRMGDCFLATAGCQSEAATISYDLATRYLGSNISAVQARCLLAGQDNCLRRQLSLGALHPPRCPPTKRALCRCAARSRAAAECCTSPMALRCNRFPGASCNPPNLLYFANLSGGNPISRHVRRRSQSKIAECLAFARSTSRRWMVVA